MNKDDIKAILWQEGDDIAYCFWREGEATQFATVLGYFDDCHGKEQWCDKYDQIIILDDLDYWINELSSYEVKLKIIGQT